MICKIEKGVVDIPQSKISLFASALGTTPGELMGSTEEYVEDQVMEIFRVLNDDGKDRLLEYLSFLVKMGYGTKR